MQFKLKLKQQNQSVIYIKIVKNKRKKIKKIIIIYCNCLSLHDNETKPAKIMNMINIKQFENTIDKMIIIKKLFNKNIIFIINFIEVKN